MSGISGHVESTVTDHITVTAIIRLKAPKPKPFQLRSRLYQFYDLKAFNDDLVKVPWNALENVADINIRPWSYLIRLPYSVSLQQIHMHQSN